MLLSVPSARAIAALKRTHYKLKRAFGIKTEAGVMMMRLLKCFIKALSVLIVRTEKYRDQ